MKSKQKQKKLSVTLDKYPDVDAMVNRMKEEIDPPPTTVAIVVAALREYLPKRLGVEMKNNGSQEQETTLGNQIVDLKSSQKQGLSDAEFAVAKKELESDKAKNKRKGGRK